MRDQKKQLQYLRELQKADELFANQKYEECIILYKEQIEQIIHLYPQIDGLGNHQLSLGYYEWFISKWYVQGIKQLRYKGTPFDRLSLSYLSLKNKEDVMAKGIKWYRKMVDRHPEDYRFTYGLANILSNKAYYEEALVYYRMTIQIRPDWIPSYQCIAYIYEYKRIEKAKAIEMSNRILALKPNNHAALFILARNEKNIDNKIEKLKKVIELHPKYARATNQIGIVYGGVKKMYNQAIQWYKKCTLIAPPYASCYNNIGVNYELKKEYEQAIKWYFRGIIRDREYKAPHANLTDVFETLKYTEEKIDELMIENQVVHKDYFYYYLGLAYYDKQQNSSSIKYYFKARDSAKQLQKEIHKLYNSIGITYDEIEDYEYAIFYYKKCIEACPSYHSAYYNLAIVCKNQNNIEQAIGWYKQAIEVNPRYSYAYNNLGNIYKSQANYEEAIKCYKKAVQYLSTYTLALANLGICYLKLKNYREAFNAMSRAKQILPNDNNNLSESNKVFLKETLQKFDQQGESWRQNGIVTQQLKNHLQNYESKFKNLYSSTEKQPVVLEKVMKQEVLDILRYLQKDQFSLNSITQIYKLVQKLYADNEDYFYILPQIFSHFFQRNCLKNGLAFLGTEEALCHAVKEIQEMSAFQSMVKNDQIMQQRKISTSSIKDYRKPEAINLLAGKPYFQSYQQFISHIEKVHLIAKGAYSQFKSFVDQTRKQSNGIPYGVYVKLNSNKQQRFRAILRIVSKVFESQFDRNRIKSLSNRIFVSVLEKYVQNKGKIAIEDIQLYSQKFLANQINDILEYRKKNKIQTVAEIGDFVRGKIVYESVDHLKKAVAVAGNICSTKGYKILRMQNRLLSQTQDYVINIQLKNAICELKLSLTRNEDEYHLLQLMDGIEQCPLGCVFGSTMLLFKEVQYSLLRNCRDIAEHLADSVKQKEKLSSASYVLTALNDSNLVFK